MIDAEGFFWCFIVFHQQAHLNGYFHVLYCCVGYAYGFTIFVLLITFGPEFLIYRWNSKKGKNWEMRSDKKTKKNNEFSLFVLLWKSTKHVHICKKVSSFNFVAHFALDRIFMLIIFYWNIGGILQDRTWLSKWVKMKDILMFEIKIWNKNSSLTLTNCYCIISK